MMATRKAEARSMVAGQEQHAEKLMRILQAK